MPEKVLQKKHTKKIFIFGCKTPISFFKHGGRAMTEEFNLSKHIQPNGIFEVVPVTSIKEFIKQINEEICQVPIEERDLRKIHGIIKKRAGDKLT